ncbi:MAG: hypothetical protein QOF76_2119 [Solirubrobacteraceae bacterium]|jgi:ribosomal protein S18 acetylase RimI-like enzyme|nr:hypothetical protein [Solirubrobacteraceae bacterium]
MAELSPEIRGAAASDLGEITALHLRGFPGATLSRLGPSVVTDMYREFLDGADGYLFVAVRGGRIVGFVAAADDGAALRSRFLRHSGLGLAPVVARRAARDPVLRRELRSRLLRRISSARRDRVPPTVPAPVAARLLSIAVDEPERGAGVAEALVGALCAAMQRGGVAMVGLSVRHDNPRALRFYLRTGWEVERSSEDGIYLRRLTGADAPSG